MIGRLPACKRQSLTLDNGREFARPAELERRLGLPIFFAHPYHAWERGTNENTNGLLRQYLPKGSDLALLSAEQLRSCDSCVESSAAKVPRLPKSV